MKIAGEYTFDAPRDVVWDALQTPEVLAAIMPGCEKLEEIGNDEYEGALKIRIGPVQGLFNGKIKLEDIVKPEGYTMKVDGRGAPGFVNATGALKLNDNGDTTHLTYEGDAQVGGRIASVGQRLVDSSAKAIIKQSLEGLNEAVKARSAVTSAAAAAEEAIEDTSEAVAGAMDDAVDTVASVTDNVAETTSDAVQSTVPAQQPPPIPKVEAPSQTEFATNVAKEVAKDLIPKPIMAGIILIVVVIILYFLLGG